MRATAGVVDVSGVLLIAGGAAVRCVAVQAAGELRKHGLVGWLWRQPASFSATVVDPVFNVSKLRVSNWLQIGAYLAHAGMAAV
jgi:hypothetical protein